MGRKEGKKEGRRGGRQEEKGNFVNLQIYDYRSQVLFEKTESRQKKKKNPDQELSLFFISLIFVLASKVTTWLYRGIYIDDINI